MSFVLVSNDAIEYDIEIKIINGTTSFKVEMNRSPMIFEEITTSGIKKDDGTASKKPKNINNDILFSIIQDQPRIFLEYLDLEENEFWEVVDRFRRDHIWKRDGNSWSLKNQVS